jgi:uncharacterized protein (DUF305 family)
MSFRYYRAAGAGAAVIAAVTLSACGTGTSAGTPASSAPAATAPAFNTADVTFTTSMLTLEGQAAALASDVPAHTSTPGLQQFAASMQAQAGDAQRMREMMAAWHQPALAPYSPGASLPAGMMGTGMMDAAEWAQISGEDGQAFDSRWLDAMVSGYNAEIALCQHELASGASAHRPARWPAPCSPNDDPSSPSYANGSPAGSTWA